MPMKYYRLFDYLNRHGMKKSDLLQVISSPTLAKLSHGDPVNTTVLCAICSFLNCQPDTIMEYEFDASESKKQMSGPVKSDSVKDESESRKQENGVTTTREEDVL